MSKLENKVEEFDYLVNVYHAHKILISRYIEDTDMQDKMKSMFIDIISERLELYCTNEKGKSYVVGKSPDIICSKSEQSKKSSNASITPNDQIILEYNKILPKFIEKNMIKL